MTFFRKQHKGLHWRDKRRLLLWLSETQTYSSDGGLQFVTSRGVGHVSTQKNDRFPKNLGTVKQLVHGVCRTHENKITSHTIQQSQAPISRHVIISITLHQLIYIHVHEYRRNNKILPKRYFKNCHKLKVLLWKFTRTFVFFIFLLLLYLLYNFLLRQFFWQRDKSKHNGRGFYSPNTWQKDVVDTAQLDVDLEAEIGQGLGGCFVHVFGLNTLCG